MSQDYDPQDCLPTCRIFKQSKPVARKNHDCECGFGWIAAGERYSLAVGLDEDGRFFIQRLCLACKHVPGSVMCDREKAGAEAYYRALDEAYAAEIAERGEAVP